MGDRNDSIRNAITDALLAAAASNTNSLQQADVGKTTTMVNAEVKPIVQHLTNNEPWYQSRVTWGAIIAMSAPVLGYVGIQADILDPDEAVRIAVGAMSVIGGAISLWGRWVARKPIGE